MIGQPDDLGVEDESMSKNGNVRDWLVLIGIAIVSALAVAGVYWGLSNG